MPWKNPWLRKISPLQWIYTFILHQYDPYSHILGIMFPSYFSLLYSSHLIPSMCYRILTAGVSRNWPHHLSFSLPALDYPLPFPFWWPTRQANVNRIKFQLPLISLLIFFAACCGGPVHWLRFRSSKWLLFLFQASMIYRLYERLADSWQLGNNLTASYEMAFFSADSCETSRRLLAEMSSKFCLSIA